MTRNNEVSLLHSSRFVPRSIMAPRRLLIGGPESVVTAQPMIDEWYDRRMKRHRRRMNFVRSTRWRD
jgi:hypothetical protein